MKPAPLRRVRWARAFRIINARYPPIDVFERVAPPEDWETLYAVEALTNPRVRQEWGDISRVPVAERVSGPGASWVMAAFTHTGAASRFTDGRYGVYYAGRTLRTAVAETAYHFGRFLRATAEPRGTEVHVRVLVSTKVDARFHDVRDRAELHLPDDYRSSQAYAASLRNAGSSGLLYRSVRHHGGECLAVFRPRAIPKPAHAAYLRYHFDGEQVDRWFRIGGDSWEPVGGPE